MTLTLVKLSQPANIAAIPEGKIAPNKISHGTGPAQVKSVRTGPTKIKFNTQKMMITNPMAHIGITIGFANELFIEFFFFYKQAST